MTTQRRSYKDDADFDTIGDFLTRHYQPGNRDGNLFQAIWEYAYFHSWFDRSSLGRVGIWEDEGQVVGIATYEMRPGEVWLNTHPDYAHLKPDLPILKDLDVFPADLRQFIVDLLHVGRLGMRDEKAKREVLRNRGVNHAIVPGSTRGCPAQASGSGAGTAGADAGAAGNVPPNADGQLSWQRVLAHATA